MGRPMDRSLLLVASLASVWALTVGRLDIFGGANDDNRPAVVAAAAPQAQMAALVNPLPAQPVATPAAPVEPAPAVAPAPVHRAEPALPVAQSSIETASIGPRPMLEAQATTPATSLVRPQPVALQGAASPVPATAPAMAAIPAPVPAPAPAPASASASAAAPVPAPVPVLAVRPEIVSAPASPPLTSPVAAPAPQPPRTAALPAPAPAPAPAAPAVSGPTLAPAAATAAPLPLTSPRVAMPDGDRIVLLIRTAMLSLNDALKTGNYTVLRDIGGPTFREYNSAARLSQLFSGLGAQGVDLSMVAVMEPLFTETPALDARNTLRLRGYFPGKPVQINFDILYEPAGGHWRLFGLSVNAAPAMAPAAEATVSKTTMLPADARRKGH